MSIMSAEVVPFPTKHIPLSQYDSLWNVQELMEEAKRLTALPRPDFNVKIIMRWRRKQVWFINKRIAFIAKNRGVKSS